MSCLRGKPQSRKHRERETARQTDGQRERETQRQRERQTGRETYTGSDLCFMLSFSFLTAVLRATLLPSALSPALVLLLLSLR